MFCKKAIRYAYGFISIGIRELFQSKNSLLFSQYNVCFKKTAILILLFTSANADIDNEAIINNRINDVAQKYILPIVLDKYYKYKVDNAILAQTKLKEQIAKKRGVYHYSSTKSAIRRVESLKKEIYASKKDIKQLSKTIDNCKGFFARRALAMPLAFPIKYALITIPNNIEKQQVLSSYPSLVYNKKDYLDKSIDFVQTFIEDFSAGILSITYGTYDPYDDIFAYKNFPDEDSVLRWLVDMKYYYDLAKSKNDTYSLSKPGLVRYQQLLKQTSSSVLETIDTENSYDEEFFTNSPLQKAYDNLVGSSAISDLNKFYPSGLLTSEAFVFWAYSHLQRQSKSPWELCKDDEMCSDTQNSNAIFKSKTATVNREQIAKFFYNFYKLRGYNETKLKAGSGKNCMPSTTGIPSEAIVFSRWGVMCVYNTLKVSRGEGIIMIDKAREKVQGSLK